MDEFKEPYLILFRAVTKALTALEQGCLLQARSLLVAGQQKAEERYLNPDSFEILVDNHRETVL